MFRNRLENLINLRHGLCRLAGLIDWSAFDRKFGLLYSTRSGCQGKPTRLMVDLQYLKHIHGLSDEAVVQRWAENPYWQHFCGEAYFQHEMPIDPSNMTWLRQRIGASGDVWFMLPALYHKAYLSFLQSYIGIRASASARTPGYTSRAKIPGCCPGLENNVSPDYPHPSAAISP